MKSSSTSRSFSRGSLIAFNRWHRNYGEPHDFSRQHGSSAVTSDVLIIYTGGTLGMQKDENGALAPMPGCFTDAIFTLEELVKAEMPTFDVVEYECLLDSSCFTPSDWGKIGRDIEKAYKYYKGFVVCMGTDTMAYAASALSFMLENLSKPVIFTGSQIPFVEAFNDARRNVIVSILIASSPLAPPEVSLFFNDRLLRGNRACKMYATRLNAFQSLNFPPLATLDVNIQYKPELYFRASSKPLKVNTEMDSNIIVLKLIPGFDDEALISLINHSKTLRAIVILAYGTGNSPNRREGFLQFVKRAVERNIIIVALTQCPTGGVSLDAYAVGVQLKAMGVVSGEDMTTEAAVTKLAHLFSIYGSDTEKVKTAMQLNIRGELSASKVPTESSHELILKSML